MSYGLKNFHYLVSGVTRNMNENKALDGPEASPKIFSLCKL